MKNVKLIALSLVLAAVWLSLPGTARGQSITRIDGVDDLGDPTLAPVCANATMDASVKEALRLVCRREPFRTQDPMLDNAIVIGFVGGFVKAGDEKHPEVQFASFLRHSYPSVVRAQVFSNHDGHKALRRVLQLLDDNEDGVLTATEKQQAKIIIYGHSWGASQAVTLARQLEQEGVPVLLTILVDSVHKPGHHDSTIPPNVRMAVNFYQTKGPIHGRSTIKVQDPERTRMLGNFRMTYGDRRISTDNYPWISRHLNKPHHEIENDPQLWDEIASLIDSQLFVRTSVAAALPAGSAHGGSTGN